ncbi:MAG TPA: hypothetical protein VKB49_16750 [Candidatus Sulfotelmatobacter sp.]|nr:hypothetical protein [Candidatus Sulfotelmatobacter sp.]
MSRKPALVLFFCLLSRSSLVLVAALIALTSSVLGQDVLTYHNNNARNGLNSGETQLTLNNVNYTSFGLQFVIPVDGLVDAEPLYLSSLTVGGTAHNVLIVATEHDSVYAFDADTGATLWHVTTLKPGETTSDDRGCSQVEPEIGITSTPVIYRPSTGVPVIYLVAMSKDSSGHYHQRLHALSAITGGELLNGPVEITGKYPGTGDDSRNGYVFFDPAQYKERAGLLRIGGTIYLTWASHCDYRPYTGWIMRYSATTLKQTGVLNLTPNGNEGAVWGSGAGMAADTSGNIFLLDANGVFDTTLNSTGFPAEGDYGNAFLRISTTGGLAVADYFEMYNQAIENLTDTDLGSGGAVLVNINDSNGNLKQLAVGAGKDSNLYVVDRNNMGKFNSDHNDLYQELPGALPGGMWSMPAAWNGNVYFGPVDGPILDYQFQDAKLLSSPVAKTKMRFPYPGATPSISTNGGKDAILWATTYTNPAILFAFNARTLEMLYNSIQAPQGRDHFGKGNKFITPIISHGKVYVGTVNGVGVFGLLSQQAAGANIGASGTR